MFKTLFIAAIIFLGLGNSFDVDVEQSDGTLDTYRLENVGGELIVTPISGPEWRPWSAYWKIFQLEPDEDVPAHYVSSAFGIVTTIEEAQEDCIYQVYQWNKDIVAVQDMSLYNVTVTYQGHEYTWVKAAQLGIVYRLIYLPIERAWVTCMHSGEQYWFYAFKSCEVDICE